MTYEDAERAAVLAVAIMDLDVARARLLSVAGRPSDACAARLVGPRVRAILKDLESISSDVEEEYRQTYRKGR